MASALPFRPQTNGTTRSSSSAGKNSSATALPSRSSSTSSRRNGTPLPSSRARFPRAASDDDSTQIASRQTSTEELPAPGGEPRARRLRSQYPAHAAEKHVEYILVASFDIDRGPTMEHQFPGAISGDENMLAELMLPDQAHVRAEDWTIFFLHKDTTEEEALRAERRRERALWRDARRRGRAEAAANGDESATEVDEDEDEYGSELDEEEEEEESEEEEEGSEGPPLIYVLNLVNTKQDNTVKRS